MYLIGNLFDDDDKPIPGLALLPRSIRIKLLLLLPAVDVHKLEGTSVTADILMDEIWETLYKERNHDHTAMASSTINYPMFYEANKELSVYFTHVKESVYNKYKIATFHNVIWTQQRHGVFITTETFKNKAIKDYYLYYPLEALALTMIDLNISLKIVTDCLLELDHDILKKLTQSAEAIHWIGSWGTDIEKFFKIIFIENECRIISCICEDLPLLLLDYLQQQCDLKILDVDAYLTSEDAEKFKEVVKRHKNLELVSIGCDYYFIQCLSEILYQSCFRELNIKTNYSATSFDALHSLLSAFFLSPYPVTLRLSEVLLTLDSTVPTQVPLAINTEQQSKSLDVACLCSYAPCSLSNFLPRYIVLKSLKITRNDTLYLFSKVKSIKADEITIDINDTINTDHLRSLLSSVLTNNMKIAVSAGQPNLHQSTLEIIFNSLSPTKPPYLQLIVKYIGDDPSPVLYDTWKRCGAIKLKKAVIVESYGQEKEKYLEEMM
uniref:F-box domain-containing protein n=1 Tax=Amphimedon queenslandica TaxID=400682 RepID=A0A1X7UA40_AMPQE